MWFFGLIVVLLIGAVAVVASGRWGAMSTAYDDRPDMTVPARQALTSTDIESARFAVGVRGYRMDEVDTLLERVAKEVAERDRRIADLERAVAPIVEAPDGHGFTSGPYDPTEFEDTGTQQPILVGGDFPEPTNQPAPESTNQPEPPERNQADPSANPAPSADPEQSAQSAGSAESAESAQFAGSAQPDVTPGSRTTPDVPEAAVAPDATSPGAQVRPADATDDEPGTAELPRASQAAADEYERLQAEARAVLEAQSQPVTPRRVPAPHQQPQQEGQPPKPAPTDPAPTDPAPTVPIVDPPATHWTQQPPQEAQGQTQPQRPEQAQPQTPEQAQPQTPERAQQETPEPPQAEANGAAGVGDEEGWRFWPPADQQGEGAYQRPS